MEILYFIGILKPLVTFTFFVSLGGLTPYSALLATIVIDFLTIITYKNT